MESPKEDTKLLWWDTLRSEFTVIPIQHIVFTYLLPVTRVFLYHILLEVVVSYRFDGQWLDNTDLWPAIINSSEESIQPIGPPVLLSRR
jgi:hypothetical protein